MNSKNYLKLSILVFSLSFAGCKENKKVENTIIETSKSEEKFGLTENERKELYKEIVKAEDRANAYQRNKQDSVLNLKFDEIRLKKEYDEIDIETKKLMSKYKSEVIEKYKITNEQEKLIGFEGLDNNWSLE